MIQNNQNKNQQTVLSPPPPMDDDFAIPELTIKDESGSSQKVNLTAAPSPAPATVPTTAPVLDEEKNKLDEFRQKSSSLTGVAKDATEDIVLSDLQARAKADEALKVEENQDNQVENQVNQAENQANQVADDDDDDIFISLDDFRDEIAKYKLEKNPVENQANQVTNQANQVTNQDNQVENQANQVNDDEPVLANPMKPLAPIPAAPVMAKSADDLIPEIDLDADDIFSEKQPAAEENLSSDELSQVDVKSKQEFSRGETKRKAVVQNMMKTETIYDRSRKPDKAKRGLGSSEKDGHRTFTPIEELQVLSLDEWRRLGDIPEERIAKIKEKIEILGEKGILSQIKGLNAWRLSPVMQQYLDLGIQALLDQKGVEEYMENIDDENNLSFQEWIAINKLNSQLMI